MFSKLGLPGVVGVLVMLGGIVVVATESLVIAGGLALILAGLGFLVYGLVTQLAKSMGMGGVVG